MPTDSRKGEDDHCWMNASRGLSTPSELPLRPSYWIFRVATTSLHISCINIIGCVVWLEKTHLHRCFHRVQRVSIKFSIINKNMWCAWRGVNKQRKNTRKKQMKNTLSFEFSLVFFLSFIEFKR